MPPKAMGGLLAMAFEHSREGAGTSHTDVNIAYKAWDNSNWMARIEGESFWHFREGAPEGQGHPDAFLNYKSHDGSNWTARIQWPNFIHTKEGSPMGHTDTILNYVSWDGSRWTAKLVMPNISLNVGGMGMPIGGSTGSNNTSPHISTSMPGFSVTVSTPNDAAVGYQAPPPQAQTPPPQPQPQPQQPSFNSGAVGYQVSPQPAPIPVQAPPPQAQSPKLEAWLHKRGDIGIILDWTWKTRFFREHDDGRIYYYSDRNAAGPHQSLGKIDMNAVTKVEVNPSLTFGFNISVPGRTYVLRANTQQEVNTWVNTLRAKCPKLGGTLYTSPAPAPVHHQPAPVAYAPPPTSYSPPPQAQVSYNAGYNQQPSTQTGNVSMSLNFGGATVTTSTHSSEHSLHANSNGRASVGFQAGGGASMGVEDITALKTSVRNAAFSKDKIAVIQSSAGFRNFTCQQVFELLRELPFSDDKHEACLIMYPRIVDRQNFFVVLEAFDFSSDKEKVKRALGL